MTTISTPGHRDPDRPGGLHAVRRGHLQVHDDDVRRRPGLEELLDPGGRLGPVGGLGGDDHVREDPQIATQAVGRMTTSFERATWQPTRSNHLDT
jgi:hypothetical protein